MDPTKVYSYRRFSSGRQARGNSLERQVESARRWCREQGYELDESLALADLGVSAFKGDNVSRGALSGFIAAIEAGKVAKGSILLVESLDRLSRAALPEAVGLLTQIVRNGVRVVSMIDGKEWNQQTIEDTMSFMLSVILFSRAHEESSTKAKRVSASFQSKRKAGLPVVTRVHGGGWLRAKDDLSGWDLVPEKAESVRRVFELAAAGQGGVTITRTATAEGWPLPYKQRANSGRGWEHTGVSRLLRDRRVLGEWQPNRMVAGTLTPDGDPVLNYFPAVVADDLWHRVQAALKGRSGPLRIRGVNADVFAGLLECRCGERMERKDISKRGSPRYYCVGRKAGRSNCPPVSEQAIVHVVLSNLGQFEEEAFRDDSLSEALRGRIRIAEEKAADARQRSERIIQAIEEGGSNSLLHQRLLVIESDEAKAKQAAADAREELVNVPRIGGDWGAGFVTQAAEWIADKSKSAERHRLAEALRRIVDRIVFEEDALMIYQKTGEGFWAMIPPQMLKRAERKVAKKES